MIYLDNAATTLHKPVGVADAVRKAMFTCANPGRGGYPAAMQAANVVFHCRERAAKLFHCQPEQVVFTANCTHALNIAITTLVKPGSTVVISGFEHNAVTRPLHALGAQILVAGRKLFDWEDTLQAFEKALQQGAQCAVFTHVSNVFGYVLPIQQMARLCKQYGVACIIDAAQSAGTLPIDLLALEADFVAMPGHKGLLGPQGTGILLCNRLPKPLICGGTGSNSKSLEMPDFLPDAAEAGTLNVPGIAGLGAALEYLLRTDLEEASRRETEEVRFCAGQLEKMGLRVFAGDHQSNCISFVPQGDCEEAAARLARKAIAVRAGFHCAPLAHESAGTLDTGTVRISFGKDAARRQSLALLNAL